VLFRSDGAACLVLLGGATGDVVTDSGEGGAEVSDLYGERGHGVRLLRCGACAVDVYHHSMLCNDCTTYGSLTPPTTTKIPARHTPSGDMTSKTTPGRGKTYPHRTRPAPPPATPSMTDPQSRWRDGCDGQ